MSRFVLVHGAWHGAWCWERVLPRLRDHGHQVQTITLAGLGDRAGELSPDIGLEDHVRDVAEALDDGPEPVLLVGHSYGGLVVRDAALQRPADVSEVVLVEGWIGPPGKSLLDLAPGWFADGIWQAAERGGDGWRIPVPDPAVVGVSEPEDAAWLRQRMTEHPAQNVHRPRRQQQPRHRSTYARGPGHPRPSAIRRHGRQPRNPRPTNRRRTRPDGHLPTHTRGRPHRQTVTARAGATAGGDALPSQLEGSRSNIQDAR
jgi:pimeloyl-ACP methyl ester carboxylesterase